MRIPAWFLFLLFTFWNAAAFVLAYKDVSPICISIDQEENVPEGESESDAGTETYIHAHALLFDAAWNSQFAIDVSLSTAYTKSFYKLLTLPTFFTPPEV